MYSSDIIYRPRIAGLYYCPTNELEHSVVMSKEIIAQFSVPQLRIHGLRSDLQKL
jgi:hypothetical protein